MTENLKNRCIALVGGAGFIGHHLALHLAEKGADVHVVDGLQVNHFLSVLSGRLDRVERHFFLRVLTERMDLLESAGVGLHVVDARDYLKLSEVLSEVRPDTIVHLAAVAHAGRSNKDPLSTFDHNLRTLENCLDWARGIVRRFVFFSSSMVYGNFEGPVVTEDHPLNPIGIYGALKLAGEKLVLAYHQVFDLPFTIVRPSALYGPRCISRRVGQVFIERAMEGSTLEVEGDGSDRLDFTYIDDLVEGVARVISREEAQNEVFNLTYGESRSIRELVEVIREEFPEIRVSYRERDDLMPVRGTLSVEKARRMLGYEPRYPIEKGIPQYIAWYRRFLGESDR